MTIKHKCACGAEVTFDDEHRSYINGGGAPDSKGRIFKIEVMSDEWLEVHKNCIKKPDK